MFKLIRPIFWVLSLFFAFAITVKILTLLFYVQPVGDDFFGVSQLAQKGFWGANKFIFETWDARYTATFLSLGFQKIIGFRYGYGLSGLFLICITWLGFFTLFYFLLSEINSRFILKFLKAGVFTFVFWAVYWIIAKPDVTNGADSILIGQFVYNAGAFCYQTALVLSALSLVWMIYLFKFKNKKNFFYIINYLIFLFILFLIIGTNEGSALMILCLLLYALAQQVIKHGCRNKSQYQSQINNFSALNFWALSFFCFAMGCVIVFYSLGDQVRMLYYQTYPDQWPYLKDWISSTQGVVSQSFFLILFFLINPIIFLFAWIFYPELKAMLKFSTQWVPLADLFCLLLGLIFLGFFSVVWTMGNFAPPRYYGVMAVLAFWLVLNIWTVIFIYFETVLLIIKNNKLLNLFKFLFSIFLLFLLILIIYARNFFIPVWHDLGAAIQAGPEFKLQYDKLWDSLEKAHARGETSAWIDGPPMMVFPKVKLLDYGELYKSRKNGPEKYKTERCNQIEMDLMDIYKIKNLKYFPEEDPKLKPLGPKIISEPKVENCE